MTGADWLLAALAEEGVTALFGNPGSTELPILDAFPRQTRMRYVLALHEHAAIGMADGYAQASGRLAAVNVHVQPGMANALSGVLNAARARVPLLVTVGQQVSGMLPGEPFLGGDVLSMARPLAKAVFEPRSPAKLREALARASATALSHPRGPVVLSLPLEVQAAPAPAAPHVASHPADPPAPPAERLDEAAALLSSARSPAVLGGDGVGDADARGEIARVAERLGAPVFGEPMAGRVCLAWNHPLWAGPLPPFAVEIRDALREHDVILAVGMPVFRLFGHSPGDPLPAGARLVHLEVDRHEVGKVHTPDVGLVGDPRAGLALLAERLGPADDPALERRTRVVGRLGAARREARRAAMAASAGPGIPPAAFARAVADAAGPNDLVVDESVTSGRMLRAVLSSRRPGTWLAHRGSALGWGLPAAVGAAIALPGRRVMSLHGDGGLLFAISAVWTAARERVPLALAVADNRGYEILRAGLEGLTGSPERPWPGLWIDDPPLDIAGLIRGHGASAEEIGDAGTLRDAFEDLWQRAASGPAALVVRVSGRTPGVGHPLPPG